MTPEHLLLEALDQVQLLTSRAAFGPYTVFVAQRHEALLAGHYYPPGVGIQRTVRQRLLQILGVQQVLLADQLESVRVVAASFCIVLGADDRCTCDCAAKCPLGRVGTQARCTKDEIHAKDIPTVYHAGR